MTRFIEEPNSDRSLRNGKGPDVKGPGVPSFLRPEPEDRPDPTDLSLHFHESGPSFRATAAPAAAATTPAAPGPHAAAPAPAAAPQGEETQVWAPSLAYRAVAASTPKPDDYAIAPDSYLAVAEALTSNGAAEGAPPPVKEWDPLTDPWPAGGRPGASSIEATLLERAAREVVAPYGLMTYEASDFALPDLGQGAGRPEPDRYAPVDFRPTPYRAAGEPAHQSALETGLEPGLETGLETHLETDLGMTQPFDMLEHPSGPLPRRGEWPPSGPVPDSPAGLTRGAGFTPPAPGPDAAFDVTLTGPLGTADLGFTGGRWYSIAGEESRPVTVGDAVWSHPELSGQIVQVACWWMRENPKAGRAVDLATEIAMAVSDATRGNRTPLAF